nr:carbonic anhydrase [Desulfobulbaceae bacterium]
MFQKLCAVLIITLAFSTLAAPGNAKMRNLNKIRAGIPPYTIIKSVLAANDTAISAGITGQESATTPYLTWLAESDERIVSNMIAAPETQIFSIRNFGNQLELDTGAIDYGIRHLLTPVLMITSSSDNKSVQLFMEGYQDLSPAIRRELDHLHLALYRDNKDLEYEERLIRNVEANVDYQVDMALARYQDRVASGRLVVVGSILDLNNSYQHGAGRLLIINVNGERNSAKLKAMELIKPIGLKTIQTNIGRQRLPAKPAEKDVKPKVKK